MNNNGRNHTLTPRERRTVRRCAEFGIRRKTIAEMFCVHEQTIYRYQRVDPGECKRTKDGELTERELEALRVAIGNYKISKELLSVVFESTIL